jgi:ferredoxin
MIKATYQWIARFFNPPKESRMDLGRRQMLAAGIIGLGGGWLSSAQPLAGARTFNAGLIRPPGSASEDEFLDKCVRCGECMKACPTNAIQPTMLEAGLEGLWSPVIKTQLSYCAYECTMCTQVCPTEAIQKMTLEEKKKVKIGLAHIDKARCLPYAYSRPCVVCEQNCPLPQKAIWSEETTVSAAGGKTISVKQPHVNAELCIGCGICENKCPVSDGSAIRVTSMGETRNLKNRRFLLMDQYGG